MNTPAPPSQAPRIMLGEIPLHGLFALSPMAEFTSWPLRLLAQRFGAAFACTEMVKAHFVTQRNAETLQVLKCHPDERLCGGQICGYEEETLREACQILTRELNFPFVDFNLACPIKRVVSQGAGGGLLQHPEKVRNLVSAMVAASAPAPVTVKIRSGLNADSITAVEIAQAAEAGGAAMVAVHPRTVKQGYGGRADHQVVKDVAENVGIPVVGGGDINSPEDAATLLRFSGCDLVYFARAAIGNPWIFQRTQTYWDRDILDPQPDRTEIATILLEHVKMLIEHLGEDRACRHTRKLSKEYGKLLPEPEQQKSFYEGLRSVESWQEIKVILNAFHKSHELDLPTQGA